MIQLRTAEPADVPWILEQLKEFDNFFGSKHSLYPNLEYGTAKVTQLIENHVALITYSDIEQQRVGFMIGLLSPHFFNPEVMTLTELFWWVTPDWRNTRAGLMLLREFIEIGKKHSNWILMTLEEKSPVNPETLEKRGFRLWERSYLLEV